MVGAWPAPPPPEPQRDADRLIVLLSRMGVVSSAPSPLSGFVRGSMASGRVLFQVRAPGNCDYALTMLAPLASFLTGVPMLQVRFVNGVLGRALSLTPFLDELPVVGGSPWVLPDSP